MNEHYKETKASNGSRERSIDLFYARLREMSRKGNVKADDEVATVTGVLGERHSLAVQDSGGGRLYHLRQMQRLLPFVNQRHSDGRPAQGVPERQPGSVHQVVAVPLVQAVRLLPHDEHNVGGDASRDLVALLGEGDLGARLPAGPHVDAHHLVLLGAHAAGADHLPADLHLLGAALVELLERKPQVVLHGRVLPLPLAARGEAHAVASYPSPSPSSSEEHVVAHARAGPAAKRVEYPRAVRGEERRGVASAARVAEYALERVLAAKELSKDVSRVCGERVGSAAISKVGLALQTLLSNLVVDTALPSCSERKGTQSHVCVYK